MRQPCTIWPLKKFSLLHYYSVASLVQFANSTHRSSSIISTNNHYSIINFFANPPKFTVNILLRKHFRKGGHASKQNFLYPPTIQSNSLIQGKTRETYHCHSTKNTYPLNHFLLRDLLRFVLQLSSWNENK